MKKIICILFLLLPIIAKSQLSTSIGMSYFAIYNGEAANLGLNIGLQLENVHYSFSSNLATRKGTYRESTITGDFYKRGITSLSIGYKLPIKSLDNINLEFIPYIGIIWTSDVYINNKNERFNLSGDNFINIGLVSKYYFTDMLGCSLSFGYKELCSISFCVKLINN